MHHSDILWSGSYIHSVQQEKSLLSFAKQIIILDSYLKMHRRSIIVIWLSFQTAIEMLLESINLVFLFIDEFKSPEVTGTDGY